MDIVNLLRNDDELAGILCDICDVDILREMQPPQDEDGHLEYSIQGKTFAGEGSGSEYILLEDGSVGLWGSEGETGRIADSLEDFFVFMVNCPFWRDYVRKTPYENIEALRVFAKKTFEEHAEMAQEDLELDLSEAQEALAKGLGIKLCKDVAEVLMKFYNSATRAPRLVATYTEEDGSKHSNEGTLFGA